MSPLWISYGISLLRPLEWQRGIESALYNIYRLWKYCGCIWYDSVHSTTIVMIKCRSDLHSRMAPPTLSLRARYEVSFGSYTKKNGRDLLGMHYIASPCNHHQRLALPDYSQSWLGACCHAWATTCQARDIYYLSHRRHTCQNTANAAGALRHALTACNTLEDTKRFSGAVWISARNDKRTS